ncbi:MAG: 3-deoxy-D-manno-octulosonic acid transferase [Azospirillum sp.]|nr:3-deoxy-D-manno-octulosonic acid transferase [Azospirillum sp.]
MLYSLYRGLTQLGGPAIRYYLDRRRAAGKEDPLRQAERLGRPSHPRPDGPLVWFHAASIGESLSILVLVDRLLAASSTANVLVTTGTVTSAQLMARRLPARAIHQFVPVDRPGYVSGFLDHWRPNLALWIESEIWPNMLWEIRKRGIPAALLNARMSARSFDHWRLAPGFVRPLLSTFRLCLAQSETDALRLRRLGAALVDCVGNLKFSAAPPPAEPSQLAALERARNGRPVWLYASSHPGEDEIAAAVHRTLAPRLPGLLTIIAPRHPQRGNTIAERLRGLGLSVARRAEGALPGLGDAAYIADTVGEMGLLFRLAPVVCVGGSLVPHGGQNPIEPAQLGCAVLYGPHMENFRAITAELEAAGAALPVADAEALGRAAGRLLESEAARRPLVEAARLVTERNRHVVDRTLSALAPLLAEAGIPTAA